MNLGAKLESYNQLPLLKKNIFCAQFHRGSTASARPVTGALRPMTAVRGAGYTSASRQAFDPLNMSSALRNFPLEAEKEDT